MRFWFWLIVSCLAAFLCYLGGQWSKDHFVWGLSFHVAGMIVIGSMVGNLTALIRAYEDAFKLLEIRQNKQEQKETP